MNTDQENAFNAVCDGANILLTGSAGSGKSYTLNHIMTWAKDNHLDVAMTASTGCAAYLVQGRTIHSFLGIGLATKSAADLYEQVRTKKHYILERLINLDLLIIDEISMIDSALLTKISAYLSLVRKCPEAFGGVQIVLSGDFAQLPPVNGIYCFHSPEWKRGNFQTMKLNVIMRQDKDMLLKAILEEVRWGNCSPESLAALKNLKNTQFPDGIVPTVLYSKNINVDHINKAKFDKLVEDGAKPQSYKTNYAHYKAKEWATSIKLPEEIVLCAGAQVVLTWNLPETDGLFNGSRGVVKEVSQNGVHVMFTSGKTAFISSMIIEQEDDSGTWISFMPLRLAYALTIHKSQGMTLDAVTLDLGNSVFEYGQAYTALSRARDMASIRILQVVSKAFKTHKDVVDFYNV